LVPAGDLAVSAFLEERGMSVVARRGEVVDVLARPALTALRDGDLVGVLAYDLGPVDCEILALYAARQWTGAGSALVQAVLDAASAAGCRRCVVVTTNDNVDALRFYQRRGFHLVALRSGAVDEARRLLKPAIPLTGEYGIPLRDELELARALPRCGAHARPPERGVSSPSPSCAGRRPSTLIGPPPALGARRIDVRGGHQ
jgi:GNAT superfamily N-acetyltransferase